MRLKKAHTVAIGLIAAASIGAGILSAPRHVGPAALYPDPTLTPGLVATQDFNELTQTSGCGTYSQCHRNTTAAQKTQVRAEYPNCPKEQEIDHVVPLAIGGADDVKNLWCQSLDAEWNGQNWGYKVKDTLEAYLAFHLKNGDITPKAAQECILSDWIACYRKYISMVAPAYGSTIFAIKDPDDETAP